jgi:hypothetical protein
VRVQAGLGRRVAQVLVQAALPVRAHEPLARRLRQEQGPVEPVPVGLRAALLALVVVAVAAPLLA